MSLVYLADSSEPHRLGFALQARSVGLNFKSFNCGEDLISEMEHGGPPRAVVAEHDMGLGNMMGLQLLHVISGRGEWKYVTIVIFSEDESIRELVHKYGGIFVKKPNYEDLLLCLTQLK